MKKKKNLHTVATRRAVALNGWSEESTNTIWKD